MMYKELTWMEKIHKKTKSKTSIINHKISITTFKFLNTHR